MSADKKLVTIYVRKSRLKNDDEMELTRQIELLTNYADANNMEYEVFPEEGSSEDWEGRPELQKMLKKLESGIYDGVLVTEQDRISRDAADMGMFKRLCRREGLLLFTLNKTYNFMNDDDNFMTGIQAEMDNHFMRITKRKLLRGRIQALKDGVYFGIPPIGYYKDPKANPKRLLKHETEAKIIESIFDWYVNKGMNQTHIAEKLNLLGHKTRENKDFTSRSISVILNNIAYIGTLHYELKNNEPITVEDAHEAIISKEIFNAAQIIRSEARTAPQQSKRGKYLLSKLITCPKCETTLSFCMKYNSKSAKKTLNKNEREAFVLNCHSSLSGAKKQGDYVRCTNMGVKASRIEEEVFRQLEKHLVDLDDRIELILQEGDSIFEDIHSQIKQIDNRMAQLETQKKRVQDGFAAGIYDTDEAKAKIKELKEDSIKLEAAKAKIENMNATSEVDRILELKENILTLLSSESMDVEETNTLLKKVIKHVYYYKDKPDNHQLHPIKINIVYN